MQRITEAMIPWLQRGVRVDVDGRELWARRIDAPHAVGGSLCRAGGIVATDGVSVWADRTKGVERAVEAAGVSKIGGHGTILPRGSSDTPPHLPTTLWEGG